MKKPYPNECKHCKRPSYGLVICAHCTEMIELKKAGLDPNSNPIPRAKPASSDKATDNHPEFERSFEIFQICNSYESGFGHGLSNDGFDLSKTPHTDPRLGEAYQIGYEAGNCKYIKSEKL